MTFSSGLSDRHLALPVSGDAPDALMVLLHGYGANGQDLLPLSSFFGAFFPKMAFIAPDAPNACPQDFGITTGFQWFSLEGWTGKFSAQETGAFTDRLQDCRLILHHFLTAQLDKYKIKPERLILLGFSQGTMVALDAALTFPHTCGAVLGYSGAFLWDPKHPLKSKPQTLLVHGDQDDVVPHAAMVHAQQTLLSLNVPVQTVLKPGLGHGINRPGLEDSVDFLKNHTL